MVYLQWYGILARNHT